MTQNQETERVQRLQKLAYDCTFYDPVVGAETVEHFRAAVARALGRSASKAEWRDLLRYRDAVIERERARWGKK